MVKNWINSKISIGTVKSNKKIIIIFESLDSLEDVTSVTTSCGCSKAEVKDNTIVVSYRPGSVPIHMIQSGMKSFKTSKTIKVYYGNGKIDVLHFNGIVEK